ncbi:MAG: hypothetical protein RL091_659 [Verrucomicrobiota bacterium]|jgi:hypothetical protein
MKLIWHIIRKDIARDRWAIGIWALLFLSQVLLGFIARNPGQIDEDYFLRLQLVSIGLVQLQVVMGYILVTRFVHADPVVGTTAFWLTRPIAPGRLLLAKGLGVLLVFALLPVLLFLPWWLYCSFSGRDVFWSSVDVVGWQLLVIAPAFLVATVTDDLGRVLLWTLLLVVGVITWIALLQVTFGPLTGRVDVGAMYSRIWCSALALIAVSAVVTAHHYLTRRFVRSVGLIVIGLALVVAVGRWGKADLSAGIASLAAPTPRLVPGLGDQVEIRFESSSGAFAKVVNKVRPAAEEARLHVLLRATNVPEDLGIGVEVAKQNWEWADGIALNRGWKNTYSLTPWATVLRRHYSLPESVADVETDEWYQRQTSERRLQMRRAGVRVFQPPILPTDRTGLLAFQNIVPSSFFVKMQNEPPAYRADLNCELYRPEVVAELPVDRESRASGDGETFRFHRLSEEDEALIMTSPNVSVNGLWNSSGISDARNSPFTRRRTIIQVNRVTGDVAMGTGRGVIHMMVAGVSVYWKKLDLKSPHVIRAGQQVEKDPQWREHTFLAVMAEDRLVSRFSRVVQTDRFVVTSEQTAP